MVKKDKIKSKEELLQIMNEHLTTQQKFAMQLKAKAEQFIDVEDEEDDSKTKKKRRSYLGAYNAQVDAVSRTSASMIKIFNSSLENEEEQENGSDSLVD